MTALSASDGRRLKTTDIMMLVGVFSTVEARMNAKPPSAVRLSLFRHGFKVILEDGQTLTGRLGEDGLSLTTEREF